MKARADLHGLMLMSSGFLSVGASRRTGKVRLMADLVCIGVSGIKYGYFTTPANPQWKKAPGNYVFTKQTAAGWLILYAGQCDDFSTRMSNHDRIADAVSLGGTHIFSHVGNPKETIRKMEERDIIQAYNPPMNVQHRTTDGRGFGRVTP